jgi:hypothetical protein
MASKFSAQRVAEIVVSNGRKVKVKEDNGVPL